MDLFNNREIALGFWSLALLFFGFSLKNLRESMFGVLRASLGAKIVTPVLLMAVYMSCVVFAFYYLNVWEFSLLKSTILWFCFSAVVLSWKYTGSKPEQRQFKKAIIDNLKVVIIIEFVVNAYVFSLWFELSMIPLMAAIGCVSVVAERQEKYAAVASLINWMMMVVGGLLLAHAVVNVMSDISNFWSLDTLREFLLPLGLTTMFLPFVYLFMLYAAYEELFVGIRMGNEKSTRLVWYTKKEVMKRCRFDIAKVSQMQRFDLMRISNESDVDRLVGKVLT